MSSQATIYRCKRLVDSNIPVTIPARGLPPLGNCFSKQLWVITYDSYICIIMSHKLWLIIYDCTMSLVMKQLKKLIMNWVNARCHLKKISAIGQPRASLSWTVGLRDERTRKLFENMFANLFLFANKNRTRTWKIFDIENKNRTRTKNIEVKNTVLWVGKNISQNHFQAHFRLDCMRITVTVDRLLIHKIPLNSKK